MKKILILFILTFSLTLDSYGQKDSTNASAEKSYYIKAWGSEPFWNFEFKDSIAKCSSIYGDDSISTYKLSERIENVGFTNEKVDTYVFRSENGELLFVLVQNSDCTCGYDMSDGQSNVNAFILLTINNKRMMLLGCARIISRKD